MSTIFFIRVFLALLVGFFIASRFRETLRALVVRSMPVRYRVSEQYFNIQARLSTLLAFIVAIAIAYGVNWGIGEVTGWFYSEQSEEEKVFNHPLASLPPPPPLPPLIPDTVHRPAPPPMESEVPENYEEPAAFSEEGQYFLQLHAFNSRSSARSQRAYWAGKLSRQVWIGELPNDTGPYKVLAGPFRSRREALSFKSRYGLNGFLRRLGDIQLH